jgi:hypothetical protein
MSLVAIGLPFPIARCGFAAKMLEVARTLSVVALLGLMRRSGCGLSGYPAMATILLVWV